MTAWHRSTGHLALRPLIASAGIARLGLALLLVVTSAARAHAQEEAGRAPGGSDGNGLVAAEAVPAPAERVRDVAVRRYAADLVAISHYRPGYLFWRHIFAIPDGSVAYGSGIDGRLLAVFPATGDWSRAGRWEEPSLSSVLARPLPVRPADRRDEVARRLEEAAAMPIMHNPTRGRFLQPNAARFGNFLAEWGAIYERFGVPAELGLAQAVVESGLSGTVRSEARAVGFCQWLQGNWNKLRRLSPHVIEAENQTTQAPYCAAYLAVLATKYGSFVPALSEHHAGGSNVGRTVINGERLGGEDVRSRYFLGSAFALALRDLPGRDYQDLYRTYGPRSYRYAELVFGNLATVEQLRATMPQTRIHAMRVTRDVPLAEITRRTGLSETEVRRYNPALVRRVPAGATLYLPMHVAAFGRDVTFWHEPVSDDFAAVLADFLSLDVTPDEWEQPAFERVLHEYRTRFERTRTEEGTVMAVVLAYVLEEAATDRRGAILREYRSSARVRSLFDRGVRAISDLPLTARPPTQP